MIPISTLVYKWGILRYSTYLARVTAVFDSTADLTGYRYKARWKSDYFTLGWLILYWYTHVISNDSHAKFSMRILVFFITFIVDNGSSASWDIIVIVLILDYLFFWRKMLYRKFCAKWARKYTYYLRPDARKYFLC